MTRKISKDHCGVTFNSETELCKAYGVKLSTFRARIKKGWSLEEALTGLKPEKAYQYIDHLGNKFKSQSEMCSYWGVIGSTFRRRLETGWSLEDALTRGIGCSNPASVCRDHLGNEYRSKAEMCKIYGTTLKTFNKHISEGWTLEEALMYTPKNLSSSCEDHLGNTYSSIRKMCEAYGVTYKQFHWRRNRGWSLEEALTTKSSKAGRRGRSCKDHLGMEYSSISEMCKFYGIRYNIFHARIKSGWSLERALMTGSELGSLAEDK